jgi:hypothetical protein
MSAPSLWLKDGKIVGNFSGVPILCDHCPCDQSCCPPGGTHDAPISISCVISGVSVPSGCNPWPPPVFGWNPSNGFAAEGSISGGELAPQFGAGPEYPFAYHLGNVGELTIHINSQNDCGGFQLIQFVDPVVISVNCAGDTWSVAINHSALGGGSVASASGTGCLPKTIPLTGAWCDPGAVVTLAW